MRVSALGGGGRLCRSAGGSNVAEAAKPLGHRGLAALLRRADVVANSIGGGGERDNVLVNAEAGLVVGDRAGGDDGGNAVGVGVVKGLARDGTLGQLVAVGKRDDGGDGALLIGGYGMISSRLQA